MFYNGGKALKGLGGPQAYRPLSNSECHFECERTQVRSMNIKINQLLRERPDVVREAERVLPNAVRRQHVVPLPLLRAIEQVLVLWIFDLEGDVEGPAGLNGKVELWSYMSYK